MRSQVVLSRVQNKKARLSHHIQIVKSKLGRGNQSIKSMKSEAGGYEVSSDSHVGFYLPTFQVNLVTLEDSISKFSSVDIFL